MTKPCMRYLFVLLLLLVSSNIAVAGDMVPIKGTFDMSEGGSYVGNLSHLGRFTGTLDVPVYHAANGDTLTFDPTSVIFEEIVFPIFRFSTVNQVTGGTGRFKNATGYIDLNGTINLVTLEGEGDLDGMISRPNSGK